MILQTYIPSQKFSFEITILGLRTAQNKLAKRLNMKLHSWFKLPHIRACTHSIAVSQNRRRWDWTGNRLNVPCVWVRVYRSLSRTVWTAYKFQNLFKLTWAFTGCRIGPAIFQLGNSSDQLGNDTAQQYDIIGCKTHKDTAITLYCINLTRLLKSIQAHYYSINAARS